MGLLRRLRRWLGYAILPSTDQTRAAMSRELAVHELHRAAERVETEHQAREMEQAGQMLRNNIPASDGWVVDDSPPDE